MPSSSGRGEQVDASATGRSEDARGPAGPARRPRGIARRLSLLALAISIAALVVAVLVPGPAPPGTTVATASRGGVLTIGSTCTHYTGARVTLAAPGAGTIVVSATVGVGIGHTFGTADEARIVLASSATDCTLDNYTAFVSVPPSLATDAFHFETVPLLRPFRVAGSGSVTVYVNGVMASGADIADRFDSASLVATFYPA